MDCEEVMKYENAKDILPEELLREIQKYAEGKLLYVPSIEEKRGWGQASGYRDKLKKRNRMICNKYANGRTISELADEYFLSLDSIKKIIYSKKKDKNLEFQPTLYSAVEYTNSGMMEEWIHSFLLFTCDDSEMSNELMEGEYIYFGVVKLPLRLVQSEATTLQEENKLIEKQNREGSNNCPLIIRFENNKFYVEVQKERFTELKLCKVNTYPAFILIKGNVDHKVFMKNYGKVLMFVG
jgi:Mor family transcriptional regulator